MAMGSMPPGTFGRMEPTAGYKGNKPGYNDPLPGQAKRNRPSRMRRLFGMLRRRK
jgi:hypothetical protein